MSHAESPSSRTEDESHPPGAGCRAVATVLVIGIGTLPVFMLLAPNIEEARTEARYRHDQHICRQLTSDLLAVQPMDRAQGKHVVQHLADQSLVVDLAQIDTWGTPYRAVLKGPEQQVVRVFSCGVDQVSHSAGLDFDDMSPDLAETYLDRVRQQRRRQWIIAFVVWFATGALIRWRLIVRHRYGNALGEVGQPSPD